jgi:hypothetical protein
MVIMAKMTIDELIERLEEYRDSLGGDTEVRLMTQPSWPFEYAIAGMCSSEDVAATITDEEESLESMRHDAVIYLVEGDQLGYGTKRAWECV